MTNCKYFSLLTNPTAAGTRCSPRGKFSPLRPLPLILLPPLTSSLCPRPRCRSRLLRSRHSGGGGQSLWRILASFVSRRVIGGRNSHKQRHPTYTYPLGTHPPTIQRQKEIAPLHWMLIMRRRLLRPTKPIANPSFVFCADCFLLLWPCRRMVPCLHFLQLFCIYRCVTIIS